MNGRVAIVLCLVSLVAILGRASVGAGPVGDEELAFSTDSTLLDTAGAAPIAPARVPKTGQTTSYRPRDDGALERGVAWPTPRFTDRGDGTVRDNLTGLIWLKRANCEELYPGDATSRNDRPWPAALTSANKLADGYCGLSDGSKAGQWRLPNLRELHSLIHFGVYDPSLPNTAGTGKWTSGDPFVGVAVTPSIYWTSTTSAHNTDSAASVWLNHGHVRGDHKNERYCVWPVRGPAQ